MDIVEANRERRVIEEAEMVFLTHHRCLNPSGGPHKAKIHSLTLTGTGADQFTNCNLKTDKDGEIGPFLCDSELAKRNPGPEAPAQCLQSQCPRMDMGGPQAAHARRFTDKMTLSQRNPPWSA